MYELAGSYAEAARACDDAVRFDPELAEASRLRAMTLLNATDLEGSFEALRRCLAISPHATSCLEPLHELYANEGDCPHALETARSLLAADPSNAEWYRPIARALLALEPTDGAARAALEQGWAHLEGDERARTELEERALLEMAQGDFEAAERDVVAWEEAVSGSAEEFAHYDPATAHMFLALETGRPAEAARVADAFLAKRAGWTRDLYYPDRKMLPLEVKYAAGALSQPEMAAARETWFAAEAARSTPFGGLTMRGFAWALAYRVSARSAADATDALARLPQLSPLPDPLLRTVEIDDAIGVVYLRAGRAGEALPYLKRAGGSCFALDWPIPHRTSLLHLGEALETTGDRAGACSAYTRLVSLWGHARPRSTSAEAARAAVARLRCMR
jgi:serine/threonine-protein kinase